MTKRSVFALLARLLPTQAGTDKSTSKGMRESAVWIMTTTARPHQTLQNNLNAVAVVARGGYTAVSIQDYTRISNERTEFLNFLLTPNPAGVPSTESGVLQAA